ncbi:membrane protein DedA, SNARE-associated domain [Desulfofundulus australicus DSM 11792]|uniref:Membrane protein DedA, SNARE-associated domain n=1 Tax=Desulfofundulus australicus DSM 11792 TaxID=1121425 RepID=A0A1M5BKF8_9FIRM|nr:DedA family protein [Desulfofundulus australicus]SHF42916.1 membrane protein DedA, SNARE-associated domain [Desulfofundulus australicus DSM 11792]
MKDWVLDYLGALGAGGLFLGLIVEALGIPFPGGLMTLLAGILVNQGKLDLFHIMAAAVLGFNVGATVAYTIGRCIGEPFFLRYGKYLLVTPDKFDQARSWVYRSAPAFIIFGRFVPMISNLTPYLAGISRLPFLQFLIYNFLFALSWVSINLGIGIFFGHHWESIFSLIQSRLPLLAAGVLVVCLLYIVIKQKVQHRI